MTALTLDRLRALELEGWDALSRGAGGSHYGAVMADDGAMVLPNGMVLDRAAVVASLDAAPPWARYELRDLRLLPLGDGAAALAYRATASRAGDEAPFEALMTSTYVLVDGEPRLALHQQTTRTH